MAEAVIELFRNGQVEKVPVGQEYERIYSDLKAAKDATAYTKALQSLANVMGEEVIVQHRSGYGDLHYTFMSWKQGLHGAFLNNQESRDKVGKGENVSFRSDTLTNQRTPHSPNDSTLVLNSKDFSEAVVGFVDTRGKGFINAASVKGQGRRVTPGYTTPYSAFQVETTIKGFKK